MITLIVLKIMDRIEPEEPSTIWYGVAFAFLFDMFLLSILIYCLKALTGI